MKQPGTKSWLRNNGNRRPKQPSLLRPQVAVLGFRGALKGSELQFQQTVSYEALPFRWLLKSV